MDLIHAFPFAAVLAIVPSYAVVRILRAVLKSRERPILWFTFLVVTAVWCGWAIFEAANIVQLGAEAKRFVAGAPADFPTIFTTWVIRLPLWSVFLLPSLVAAATILLMPPRTESIQAAALSCRRMLTGPYRVYVVGFLLILSVSLFRFVMWRLMAR